MSIHPEILDLIHAEIDGVASEADQVRLRDAITRDAAVRDEYRRLRGPQSGRCLGRGGPQSPRPGRTHEPPLRLPRRSRPETL